MAQYFHDRRPQHSDRPAARLPALAADRTARCVLDLFAQFEVQEKQVRQMFPALVRRLDAAARAVKLESFLAEEARRHPLYAEALAELLEEKHERRWRYRKRDAPDILGASAERAARKLVAASDSALTGWQAARPDVDLPWLKRAAQAGAEACGVGRALIDAVEYDLLRRHGR